MKKKTTKKEDSKTEAPATPAVIPNPNFPVGTKFIMEGLLYQVKLAKLDSGIEWRIVACDGNESWFTVPTLKKEIREPGFVWVYTPPIPLENREPKRKK